MAGSVSYKPDETYHTATPYLVVHDPAGLLNFLTTVLDARVIGKMEGEGGAVVHADVMVGDSHLMLGLAGDEKGFPGMVHLYLPDCDEAYRRALAAGAASLREPKDEFYGDRMAGVSDPFGNQWWFATHVEDLSEEEIERRGRELAG